VSLKAIARSYIHKIRPKAKAELGWFRQQPTLSAAIEYAALATNSRGKRYSHQRRLRKATLEKARHVLLHNSKAIAQSRSFDDLFALIDKMLGPISGIGELYVYDTSLRVGAKLGLLPEKVYLHAGTRVGAQTLGADHKAKTLEVSALPLEFRQLEPHEIEDVLCIFKGDLKTAGADWPAVNLVKRSWCN